MKSFAQYVQLVESLCPKCGMDPCHCGEVATNEAVEGDEKTHVFHATVTRGRSGVLGSTELHHVKAKSREEATSKLHKDLAAHDRKLHRLEYKGIKEELTQVDEAIKKGDFVKDPYGKIHRVFHVTGNTLHTGEYRGNNGYGGDSTLHKTKATKVPTPKDVAEASELDEADGKDYHSVHVNGRMWKTFDSKSHADNVAKKIKGATVHKYDAERLQQNYGAKAAARNTARGKQWDE